MKRNFLLMLLLTLLPMTIWAAEPISSVKLSVANVPYGTEGLTQADFLANWDASLVFGTDVIWDGKIYSENGTLVEDLKTAPVGKYYVTFTGGRYYEGTVNVNFQILKRKLFVSVLTTVDDEFLYTTYGVPVDVDEVEDPVVVEWLSNEPSGLVNGEAYEDVVSGEVTAVITTKGESDANADDEGNPFTITIPADPENPEAGDSEVDVQPYAVTLVGLTSDNYEIVCVDGLYIKQKNISDGEGLTFSLPVNFATYNGQVQEPAYKITYGNAVLVQGEEDGDFTVSYPQYEDNLGFNGPLEVGEYKTVIVGQGNFTGIYPGEEGYGEDPFLWTIKRAGLTIITLDQTKVYDGTKTFSKDKDVAYEVLLPYGIEGPDADNIGTVKIADNPSANVGSYTVTATVEDKNPNYDYNIQNIGKNTITRRGLTIAVENGKYKKLYTEADPNPFPLTWVTFTGTLVEDEESWTVPTADITAMKNSTGRPNWGAGLKITRKNATNDTGVGTFEDVLELSFADPNHETVKNYDVTFVPGDFTISGGKIYITALSQSKNYGDEEPDWTAVAYNSTTKTGNYRVDGLIGNDQLITEPTLAREEGETVGNYVISASGAVAPSGYEDIVYANGKFTINARPITITLASQTMKDGDKTSTLDQTAYTLEGTLAPGDVASDLFNLKLVPFTEAGEFVPGQDEIPEQPAVPEQYARCEFATWSAQEGGWQYAHGIVEVGDYDPFLEATKVTVLSNIADNATTGAQAQAFEGKDFYVGVEATYNNEGKVQIPGARQELLYSLTSDEAKTGIYVGIEPTNVDDVYSFESYGGELGGSLWASGTVRLIDYNEDDDAPLAMLEVLTNVAPEEASDEAKARALEFVGKTFFVNANPEEEVIGRLQLLTQNTGIYVAVGETVQPHEDAKEAVPGQPAVDPIYPGEESGVYVTDANTKKEAVALREDLDGDVATYTPGIYLNILDADKWANYEVTNGSEVEYAYVEGEAQVTVPAATLYVIPANALILDTRDTELAQKIEAEDDGDEETETFVAFANRTLKAGQWNVLVLPFETSVAELSDEFGYAVVDMLDETNATTSTVKLSLAFGEIPANTPFLVQPAEDVVLSDGIFFSKNIVYSENPEVEDMAGHHFKGTYTIHYVTSEDKSEYYLQNPTPEGKQAFVNSTSRTRIGSTGAYIKDGNSGTPNEVRYISIQDPDGEENVTAIGEIAADAASKADANADGWYNVQGMKLNAAPTQRGIYIKDGKKVLVK